MSIRQDILTDLFEAIDKFTQDLAEASDISELRFGNVIQLRDELESGKRYSEIPITYTIWIDHDGDDFHLVEGEEPLRNDEGKPHFYCGRWVHTFTALNETLAKQYESKWSQQNLWMLPK
jgi:hypothetical protein